MRERDWNNEIAKGCPFVIVVQGGGMCGEGKTREYCDFKRCPRIELEKKEG